MHHRVKFACAGGAASAVLLLAGTAAGADIPWANASSGLLTEGTNWVGGTAPGVLDVAVFSVSGSYTVTVPSGAALGGVRIDGSSPLFDLSGDLLALDFLGSMPAALRIGTSPGMGMATFTNGTIDADTVLLGEAPGAEGTLRVSGAGASLLTGFLSEAGLGGVGNVEVFGGGSIDGGGWFIGAETGGVGAASVTGSGSRFSSSLLRVGNRGEGTLTVGSGATVEAGFLSVGSNGGSGTATIATGASLDAAGGDVLVGESGVGELSFSGNIWQSADLIVGEDGGTGTLQATRGGYLLTGDFIIGSSGDGDAAVGAQANLSCESLAVGTGTGGDGLLLLGGRVTASQGASIATGFFSVGELELQPGGELVTPNLMVNAGGRLSGAGLVTGDVEASGTVAPTGVLAIDGSFSLESTQGPGSLRVEIDGTDRRVAPVGITTLAGTLRVTVAPGFTPPPGSSYTLLSTNAYFGSFSQIVTPSEDWSVELVGNDVVAMFTGGEPADLDGDGNVGAGDLAALLAVWGTAGGPADLDGSGQVGAGDLAALLAAWG